MVTYQADEALLRAAVRAAATQLDRLIVVDNSTDPGSQAVVDRVAGEGQLTRDGLPPKVAERHGNVGLSRALNVGLTQGLVEGHSLFLLLDQDSVLGPGAVPTLVDGYLRLSARFPAVELAARNIEEIPSLLQSLLEQEFYRYARGETPDLRRCPLAMTSGLLLDSRVLKRTGLFDESLFLDAVDSEFCLRSWRIGVPLYLVPAATIRHALGRPSRLRWGPLFFELREADERRLYYSTRDTLKVVRRHWRVRPFICGTLLGFVGARAVVYGLLNRRVPGGFQAIRKGLVEFLRSDDRPVIPKAV
ncbi:MAG: glycosyltransferase [Thermoplasmata archaeon]